MEPVAEGREEGEEHNRQAVLAQAQALLNGPLAARAEPAVLYIDVDEFKRINDTLGHRAGDALLERVGNRIAAATSTGVTARPAKRAGKGLTAMFDPALFANLQARLELDGELRQALEADELRLEDQLILDRATRRIVDLEALLRWDHPSGRNVNPTEFIPVAEEPGIIVPLVGSCSPARWPTCEPSRMSSARHGAR